MRLTQSDYSGKGENRSCVEIRFRIITALVLVLVYRYKFQNLTKEAYMLHLDIGMTARRRTEKKNFVYIKKKFLGNKR